MSPTNYTALGARKQFSTGESSGSSDDPDRGTVTQIAPRDRVSVRTGVSWCGEHPIIEASGGRSAGRRSVVVCFMEKVPVSGELAS